MLPSRGLVRPGQHALRPWAARPGCARGFGTAMRARAGAAAPASAVLIGHLSGRRATGRLPTTTTTAAAAWPRPPAAAAAFSLWPFSRKSSEPAAEAGVAVPDSPVSSAASSPAAAAAPPPPPPPADAAVSAAATTPPLPDPAAAAAAGASPDPALAQLLDGSALLDLPSDQIGYLHALGLDFGWGPTSMCQWLLEHVHVYLGLPWWASVAAAALVFRAAILLPSLTAAEHSARLQVLRKNPKYAGALAEMQQAALQRGAVSQARAMELRLLTKRMQDAAGIVTWKMFIPMINVPFGFGMFRLLRAMAALPVPSLEDGGVLWFADLTVPDPYFALPLASAAIMYLIFRTNIKYMAPEQQTTMKYVQLVITPISILVTVKMSAGLTLFFFVSSFLQLLQTWLWHQPWLRAWKGLPPMRDMLQGIPPPGAATAAAAATTTAAASTAAAASTTAAAAAARPVAFRLDPNSSWQAPRVVPTTATATTATSTAGDDGLPAPPTAAEVVKKGWNKMVGTAKQERSATQDKEAYRKADEYEKRRAMEDEERLYQRREAERKFRQLKKTLAKER